MKIYFWFKNKESIGSLFLGIKYENNRSFSSDSSSSKFGISLLLFKTYSNSLSDMLVPLYVTLQQTSAYNWQNLEPSSYDRSRIGHRTFKNSWSNDLWVRRHRHALHSDRVRVSAVATKSYRVSGVCIGFHFGGGRLCIWFLGGKEGASTLGKKISLTL
jgi:hypothetical protein